MSGKFKREVARSQTLSQISIFSSQVEDVPMEIEHDKSLGQFQNSYSNFDIFRPKSNNCHDLNEQLPINKQVNSHKISPGQSKPLTDDLMRELEIDINAISEYDLDKKDGIIFNNYSLENDYNSQTMNNKLFISQNIQSLFMQNQINSSEKKIQQQILNSQLGNGNNVQNTSQINEVGFVYNSLSLEQNLENHLNQKDFLKVSDFTKEGQQLGSSCSNKQFKEKDCSIVYNSNQINQIEISCNTSIRINQEVNRNLLNKQNIQQNRTFLIEEDEGSSNIFSNSSYSNSDSFPDDERKKEIMKEYTQSTISRLNHLNGKIIEFEQSDYQDFFLKKYCQKYITQKLRIMKCIPFSSIQLKIKYIQSNQDYQTFHSNQSCIVKINPNYISKISLDIDQLYYKDICITTNEIYTFVLPLDPHFSNVILLGTLSGKILLYSLTQENQKKKYILKQSHQIFKIQSNQKYPTCAFQYKSNFYIGGNDGSIHLYDFKKQKVICTLNNNYNITDKSKGSSHLGNSIFDCDILESSSIKNQQIHKNTFSIKSIQVTYNKVLFSKQDGTLVLVNRNDLSEVLFKKKLDGLLKHDFSCDNDNNIIILTDKTLEIIHIPLDKIVFKMKSNKQDYQDIQDLQKNIVYSDFQVNRLTKEVILLSNNNHVQSSRIQILTNKTTCLKEIESFTSDFIMKFIVLDKQMQNMFCIGENEIKIQSYYNQSEQSNIQKQLLDKLSEPDDVLTTTDSCCS